jgi:hypothetical protein
MSFVTLFYCLLTRKHALLRRRKRACSAYISLSLSFFLFHGHLEIRKRHRSKAKPRVIGPRVLRRAHLDRCIVNLRQRRRRRRRKRESRKRHIHSRSVETCALTNHGRRSARAFRYHRVLRRDSHRDSSNLLVRRGHARNIIPHASRAVRSSLLKRLVESNTWQ